MNSLFKVISFFIFLNFNLNVLAAEIESFDAKETTINIINEEEKESIAKKVYLKSKSMGMLFPKANFKANNVKFKITKEYLKSIFFLIKNSNNLLEVKKWIDELSKTYPNKKIEIKFLLELLKAIKTFESKVSQEVLELLLMKIFELDIQVSYKNTKVFLEEFDQGPYASWFQEKFKRLLCKKNKDFFKKYQLDLMGIDKKNDITVDIQSLSSYFLLSPDSSLLLIDSDNNDKMIVVDLVKNEINFTVSMYDSSGSMTNPFLVKFSPNSKLLLRSSSRMVTIYDVKTGEERFILLGSFINNALFSEDSKKVLVQSDDGLFIYTIMDDLLEEEKIYKFDDKHENCIFSIKKQEGEVIQRSMFSPNGKFLLVEFINEMRVYSIENRTIQLSIKKQSKLKSSAFFLSEEKLLVNDLDKIVVYNIENKDDKQDIVIKSTDKLLSNYNICKMVLLSKNELLIQYSDNCIIYDIDTNKYHYLFKKNYFFNIEDIVVSPYKEQFLVRSLDRVVVYDIKEKKQLISIERYSDRGHKREIFSAKFSPNGSQLITFSNDRVMIHNLFEDHKLSDFFIEKGESFIFILLSEKILKSTQYEKNAEYVVLKKNIEKDIDDLNKKFSLTKFYKIISTYFINFIFNDIKLNKGEEIFEVDLSHNAKLNQEGLYQYEDIIDLDMQDYPILMQEEDDDDLNPKLSNFEITSIAGALTKEVKYHKRVEDWFSNVEERLARFEDEGEDEGEYKKGLLREYGKDLIILNHSFPKIIDYVLLAPSFEGIQVFDSERERYSLKIPGYYKSMINPNEFKFGNFEISYVLEDGKKIVFHRFFRLVKKYEELVDKKSKITIEKLKEMEEKSLKFDRHGWGFRREKNGWFVYVKEERNGFISFRKKGEDLFYVLLPCLLDNK